VLYKTKQGRELVKKNIIQTIGDKEMDRKDFLKYSGLVLLSVVGLKAVVNLLTQFNNPEELQDKATHGFGSGKYGS